MKKYAVFLLILVAALGLSGCAKNINADEYNANNANSVQRVETGVIVSKRVVTVDTHNQVGSIAGAIAGGILGSTIGGGGATSALAATGGAVAGGVLGDKIGNAANRQKGIEYIVKLDNGHAVSLVQGLKTQLAVGERVLVIVGAKSRIIPDTNINTSSTSTSSSTTTTTTTKKGK